jgi:hypothetical protein
MQKVKELLDRQTELQNSELQKLSQNTNQVANEIEQNMKSLKEQVILILNYCDLFESGL